MVKTKKIGLENILRLDMGVVSDCSNMKGPGQEDKVKEK